jgi:hypothetical protein
MANVQKKKHEIDEATKNYATNFHIYDISLTLNAIANDFNKNMKKIHIYPYSGLIYVNSHLTNKNYESEIKKIIKIAPDDQQAILQNIVDTYDNYPISVVVFAFSMCDFGDHYVMLLKNHNTIWMWDSASANPVESKNEIYFFGKYLVKNSLHNQKDVTLAGVTNVHNVPFQPGGGAGANDVEKQNVFCHAWCLLFFYMICKHTTKTWQGIDTFIQNILYNIDTRDQELNLSVIKRFVIWIATNFLEPDDLKDINLTHLAQYYKNNKILSIQTRTYDNIVPPTFI